VSKKLPAFQFYPGDWMKDSALRLCSTFARGLLVDLLCHMFDSSKRGCLILPCGKPWTRQQVIKVVSCGEPVDQVEQGLDELVENGVIKVHADGYYYSSRMIRDEEIRDIRSKAGSKGGSKNAANRVANTKQTNEVEDEDEDEDEDSDNSNSEKKKEDPPETVFPPPLDTPEFRTKWEEWVAYRKEYKRTPWKPSTIKSNLAKLAKMGHDESITAITTAIDATWIGLTFGSGGKGSGGGGQTPQSRAEARRAEARSKEHPEDAELTF